jgi:aminoglycoside phosphotransferase (APT) family kinase protein
MLHDANLKLQPQNIIVDDGKITGIVDWEYSGLFPDCSEYVVAVTR